MLVIILLIVLALVLPLVILRPFSFSQKVFVLVIIVAHLALMFLLHYLLVYTTDYPIVIDLNVDAQNYYENTSRFANWPPFSVTKRAAINAAEGSGHFGYQYVLGTLWTIMPYPVLGIRLLKTMLFFTSLSCLMRVWRTDYGGRLAMWGFAFMSIVCMPAFYYNYRNLKDGFILALFMLVMALLDTLLRPRKNQLHPMSTRKVILAWCAVSIPLYALSTFRLYTAAMVVVAVVIHAIMATRVKVKERMLLLGVLIIIVLVGLQSKAIANMLEISREIGRSALLSPYIVYRAFITPKPWQYMTAPPLIPFHCIYLLLLPYALYALFKHFWSNINWHLFMYIMVIYVTGITGNPARKRLITIPIMVAWVLAHLAYKRWIRAEQPEYEIESAGTMDPEYEQEYIQATDGGSPAFGMNG